MISAALICAALAALAYAAPAAAREGPGLRSARWVFHPRLEVGGAYDSNFFRDAPDEDAAPLDPVWHLDFEAAARLRNRDPRRLGVDLDLTAGWRQLFDVADEPGEAEHADRQLDARSGFDAIRGRLTLAIAPRAAFSVGLEATGRYTDEPAADRLFDEAFQRLEIEAGPDLRFRPGDSPASRALEMTLGYRFAALRYLDLAPALGTARGQKDTHKLQLATRWNFFPKTAALLDVRLWVVNYPEVSDRLGASQASSPDKDLTPLRVEAGLRGLLTRRLSATVKGGLSHSFNASGESYQGFIGRLELDYRLEPRLTVRLGYARELDDDAFASYYVLDRFFAAATVNLPARLSLSARLGYDRLDYSSASQPRFVDGERVEPVLRGEAALAWAFAEPLSLVAKWSLEDNRSDFCYRLDLSGEPCATAPLNPESGRPQIERAGFTRHLLSLTVRASY
ncbi:MAG: hypothetical protein H6703_07275 [Myxococcales bacterium]|nr:hypothetical protein [Myxococcales bacterium]